MQSRGGRTTPTPASPPRPTSSARRRTGESTTRAPSGALLRRLRFIRWPEIANACAPATSPTADAPRDGKTLRAHREQSDVNASTTSGNLSDQVIERLQDVYPISPTPVSGRFTPEGSFYVDSRMDDEVVVRPSVIRPSSAESDSKSRNRIIAALLTRLQREATQRRERRRAEKWRTGKSLEDSDERSDDSDDDGGVPKWLQDAAADIDTDVMSLHEGKGASAPDYFTSGLSWRDAEDGDESDGPLASLYVEVNLWDAFGHQELDEDPSARNAATRSWVKRCATAIPVEHTNLVGVFRRLYIDANTVLDVRMTFPLTRSSATVHNVAKATLKAAAAGATASKARRKGLRNDVLVVNAVGDLAEFVYAFCASRLQQMRPLLATNCRLFRPGGPATQFLPTASEKLAHQSRLDDSHHSTPGRLEGDDTGVGRWKRLSMAVKVTTAFRSSPPRATGSDSGRQQQQGGSESDRLSTPRRSVLSDLESAIAHSRRCSEAPTPLWFRDEVAARREALQLLEATDGLQAARKARMAPGNNFRRSVLAVRSALEVKRAELAAIADAERYDYDGRRADLSTFDLPTLPSQWT